MTTVIAALYRLLRKSVPSAVADGSKKADSPRALLFILILLLLPLVDCGGDSRQPPERGESRKVTLTAMGGWWQAQARESFEKIVDQFTRETGIPVKLIPIRESPTDSLAQCLELLNNQESLPDVYPMDVIWPGIMAEHMIDLTPYLAEEARMHIPALIENDTVDGRLVGMPSYVNVALLFYRTDLLEKHGFGRPPQTWDELEKIAATIQAGERAGGNKQFWGYVWQGAAYEGLTCNALEWQISHGGGRIIEPDRTITVNNPQTIKALKRAAAWVGTISPPGVTAYKEADANNVWQSGNAAFMRGWPYAYGLGQKADSIIKGRFDVTLVPSGGARHAGTLGGLQFAVSRYSAHRDEAIAFVRYITGRRVQIERAVALSYPPTIPDLYDDPEVIKANPYYARLKVLLGGAVARPSTVTGKQYRDVSEAYFNAIHSVLTGKTSAEKAMLDLEPQLVRITGFKTGAP